MRSAQRSDVSAGWSAALSLRYARRRERTALVRRQHCGPLSVQRPFYPELDGTCHTYLLHPPAGIVGGDELTISVDLETDARTLITTPGATRWYRSSGRPAIVSQTAQVASGSVLEWLPQETLLFDGADAKLTTKIALNQDAKFFGCEILGLGRPACGEQFAHGKLDFCFEVTRDNVLMLRERLVGEGLLLGLRGHAAIMTLIASGADDAALAAARIICTEATALVAPTLIGDLLICRGLATDCAPLIEVSRELWSTLRPLILRRHAVPPRIW